MTGGMRVGLQVGAAVLLSFLPALARAEGLGAKYATRDPATCASKTEPATGAPSPEQVKRYLLSGSARRVGEGEDSFHHLILMENVQVQIGKGRPFQGGNV